MGMIISTQQRIMITSARWVEAGRHPYAGEKNFLLRQKSTITTRATLFNKQCLQQVANRYNKTPAQVTLAWGVQHDLVVVSKSINEKRIIENTDIYFNLDEDAMYILDNLQPQTRLVKGIGTFHIWEYS